jgi:NAD(P)-dependent dehydrogenase (short-subunit alcohol dehydrogenase family)
MGSAITKRLREAGMLVAGIDRVLPSDCDLAVQADVASQEEMQAAVRRIESELGPVAAFVSAAGYYESIPLTEVTDAQARDMLHVHLGGLFAGSQAVLPGMLARGDGAIVAVASELAVGGGDRDSHYAAAKGAILGLVKSLAVEVAHSGVRVNAVAPGPTNTPMLAPDSPWRAPDYLATLPTRALAEPEDVALCVDFLVRSATFATGETLNPNSGAVI